MTDIDYEALADVAIEAYSTGFIAHQSLGGASDVVARAVVAALREQGFVVVRADDVERACHWHTAAEWAGGTEQEDQDARDRLTALAAPDDGCLHDYRADGIGMSCVICGHAFDLEVDAAPGDGTETP